MALGSGAANTYRCELDQTAGVIQDFLLILCEYLFGGAGVDAAS
jgi:hypothetical protein